MSTTTTTVIIDIIISVDWKWFENNILYIFVNVSSFHTMWGILFQWRYNRWNIYSFDSEFLHYTGSGVFNFTLPEVYTRIRFVKSHRPIVIWEVITSLPFEFSDIEDPLITVGFFLSWCYRLPWTGVWTLLLSFTVPETNWVFVVVRFSRSDFPR